MIAQIWLVKPLKVPFQREGSTEYQHRGALGQRQISFVSFHTPAQFKKGLLKVIWSLVCSQSPSSKIQPVTMAAAAQLKCSHL